MSSQNKKLPSLSTIAGRAMAQLSRRAIFVTFLICLTLSVVITIFMIKPIDQRFLTFSNDTRLALINRNNELVRSSVEQAAGNMIRLLGAAENAVQQITSALETAKPEPAPSVVPFEREFYPGGTLVGILSNVEGYQSKATLDYPQIKSSDPLDRKLLSSIWQSFMNTTRPLHTFHPELKWLYMGTTRGSFLVFPTSPEIPAGYDPRVRPWYQEARKQNRLVWTSPYFTAGGNDLVLTATQPVKSGIFSGSVVGVDLVMADVINNLLSTPYCSKCIFYLINQKDEILGKIGDKTLGDTWTEAPKSRLLADDLKTFVGDSLSSEVSKWLHSNEHKDLENIPSLSRAPKARLHPGENSDYSFFSAPIDSLGWKLLGVTSKRDLGGDGDQVLASVSKLSSSVKNTGLTIALILVALSAGLLFFFSKLAKHTLRKSLQPSLDQIGELGESLDQLKFETSNEPDALNSESVVREHSVMVSAIRKMFSRLSKEAEQQRELRVQAEVGAQAKQVAHNIRSPLEALELVLPQLNDVPEDKQRIMRNALREIRDLTNMVKTKGTEPHPTISTKTRHTRQTTASSIMLLPLVESVVSERRMAFPSAQIEITRSSEERSFGIFVLANRTELRSVFSNLINNAIEATQDCKGHILIDVHPTDTQNVSISISDNGMGIPSKYMNEIGKQGFTFGKANGSGLGIFHAKTTLEQLGGTLRINSKSGEGSTVWLSVPTTIAPAWFTSSIQIPANVQMAILDDNETIHDVWNYRLSKLATPIPGLKICHFKSTDELRRWHKTKNDSKKTVFLVDYEIHGDDKNGLDIIEELGISDSSYLVTGHSDEGHVLERAEWLGVRVVPKELAATIPILSLKRAVEL